MFGPIPEFPLDIGCEGLFDEQPARVTIGRVEFEPENGMKLIRTGELLFAAQSGCVTVETLSGHSMRLFDFDNRKTDTSVAFPYTSMYFDAALVSSMDLSQTPQYNKWKLPCNSILEDLDKSMVKVDMEYRTVTNIRAKNHYLFKGSVPSWKAQLQVEVAYLYQGDRFGNQRIAPLVAFMVDYRSSRNLDVILSHAQSLKDFIDFIWLRDHDGPNLLLWAEDGFTKMTKKHRPEAKRTHLNSAVAYPNELIRKHFNEWFNKWLALPEAMHRALRNILRIVRYPSVTADLRMAMAVHAFEAMHELIPGKKSMSLHERMMDGALKYYSFGPNPPAQAIDYFNRLVEARNQIIHLRQKPKAALVGKDRVRAIYELLIVTRAMMLKGFGCSDIIVKEYCARAFDQLTRTRFTYEAS
jgi:hypothetical protein